MKTPPAEKTEAQICYAVVVAEHRLKRIGMLVRSLCQRSTSTSFPVDLARILHRLCAISEIVRANRTNDLWVL